MENPTTRQPLDELMEKLGLSNADLVAASTEQLTFKMVQKGRKGKRLTRNVQEKILNALLAAKPELKIRRRELFHYDLEAEAVEKVRKALALAQARKVSYPQFVDLLSEAGIGHYSVDVATHRITYYGANGEAHIEDGPAGGASVSPAFNEAGVRAAIADTQKGVIDYPEFLKRIASAGCSHYEANIHNRVIAYKGAGASYKENIPLANAAPEAPKPAAKTKVKDKTKKSEKNTKLVVRKRGAKKTYRKIKQHRVKKKFRRRFSR
jgi:uncharacterized protein YbcV (DUF1398 family)